MQDLALGLIKSRIIGLSPMIQLDQVPLWSLFTLQQINTPTRLGVICKFTHASMEQYGAVCTSTEQ